MNQRPVVNVQTFLNEHPFSAFQWLIFALCFLIVLLDGFDTAAIGFIAPSLINEWGVERSALGAGAERGAVRPGSRRAGVWPAGRPARPQGSAAGFGAGVRRGLPCVGLLHEPRNN